MEGIKYFGPNTYGAKAEEDMVNAIAVINGKVGTPRGGIYWCEQAIEKFFKQVLAQRVDSSNLLNRHKLLPLATEAGFSCSSQDRYLLRELAVMYYERYPVAEGEDLPEDPTWDEAKEVLDLAVRVQSWAHLLAKRRSADAKANLKKMSLD